MPLIGHAAIWQLACALGLHGQAAALAAVVLLSDLLRAGFGNFHICNIDRKVLPPVKTRAYSCVSILAPMPGRSR